MQPYRVSRPRTLFAALAFLAALAAPLEARAGAQVEERLAPSVASGLSRAVADNPVPRNYIERPAVRDWLAAMSPKLASRFPDDAARTEFLATVHYEATRAGLHRQRRPEPVPAAHEPALRLHDPAPLPRRRERRRLSRARPLQRQPRTAGVPDGGDGRDEALRVGDFGRGGAHVGNRFAALSAPDPRQRTYRGRFAPSPTGPLHFGSLVAAMASYADARHNSGAWLVRIEDVDVPRARPRAADAILHALERYGFEWDGPVWRQSSRSDAYEAALARLAARGLAYPCA